MVYVKVGSTKAFNEWHLSSEHVTPTIDSFRHVAIKAFTHVICPFLLDG
jgi:hypothetical protein